MSFTQHIREYFLSFLKRYFNPITRKLITKSGRGWFAVVHHVGRRSGKPYETPIIVAPVADGFIFELTYGPNVDWYKNVQAAGGCTLRWHKKDYTISKIEPVDVKSGRDAFPFPVRFFLRLIHKQHFFKMVCQP